METYADKLEQIAHLLDQDFKEVLPQIVPRLEKITKELRALLDKRDW